MHLMKKNFRQDNRIDKLQNSNHKQQTNIKIQCLNDIDQFFGILDFFIGTYLLFEICYLVLTRRRCPK